MHNSHAVPGKLNRPVPPHVSEIRALLAEPATTAVDRNLHDVVLIIASTSLRAGELARTKWSDIHFANRHLCVGSENSRAERFVPFGPKVLETILERQRQSPETEHLLGLRPQTSIRAVSHRLHNVSKAVCGRPIHLHSLRRFFCEQWMNLGGRPESLAGVVGWSLPRNSFFRVFDHQFESELAPQIQEQIEKLITA